MVRYFQNLFPEMRLSDVKINENDLKNVVKSFTEKILRNFPSCEKNAEDGLYLGTAGIAYMFYHLSKVPILQEYSKFYLASALEYIQPALKLAEKTKDTISNEPALLLGNGGIYAVAAAIFRATNQESLFAAYHERYLKITGICKKPFMIYGDDELFVGRAGYICGALWLSKETNTPLALHDLYDVASTMIASGRNYSKQNNSLAPLMYSYYDTEYLGAAHGLCSILQMILCLPGYLDVHPEHLEAVKGSVDCLLNLQQIDGNFPCATDDVNSTRHELVHWCHGAPGVVYLMARSYIIWGEQKYLDSCKKCADLVWRKGLLYKGPGLCHGIAGNGYVFLLLYRLTQDVKYLQQAQCFVDFMDTNVFKSKARVPDNPYSLYEGLAGTACFLADLTQPSRAIFPFNDIF